MLFLYPVDNAYSRLFVIYRETYECVYVNSYSVVYYQYMVLVLVHWMTNSRDTLSVDFDFNSTFLH